MGVVVEARGGLCNRLRVALSYRAAYGEITVIWRPDGEIAFGLFEDVFQPIQGIRFVVDWYQPALRTTDPLPVGSWTRAYEELRLRPSLEHELRKLTRYFDGQGQLEPYAAMHVRRTDHVAMATRNGLFTTDEQFRAWIPRAKPRRVYLATDNGDTQHEAKRWIYEAGKIPILPLPIPVHKDQNESGVRNTSLAWAAIDLFACAGASEFMGSGDSSYTNAILVLRNMEGWWKNG